MHTFLLYTLYTMLGYFSVTMAFFSLSHRIPLFSFIARCLTSYFCLLLCASYGVVASIALRVVGYHRLAQYTVARCFKWTMFFLTGVTFDVVSGQEHLTSTRPTVIIGNHQTELDVLLLGCVFPPYTSVTSKRSLKWVPFLGWFMTLSGTVFIDRANRATAMVAFEGAAKEMRQNRQNVFIFPEGTRSYTDKPELLPFKKGAFHLAVKAQVPILAVVAENYSHILSVKRKIFRSGKIRVKVLPPISTVGLTSADVDDLTRDTREAMLKALVSFSEDHKSR